MSWTIDGNSYSHRKTKTLASAHYPSATLSNFPMPVWITADTDIGAVCQSDGADLRFTASDGTTLLYAEKDFFSVTGGVATGLFWVNVSSVSSSANTVIYAYYGVAGASAQANPQLTWNSDYLAVYHMGEASWSGTAGEVKDAKGTKTGTAAGNATTTATNALFGRCGTFDGSGDYVALSDYGDGGAAITISCWARFAAFGAYAGVIGKGNPNGNFFLQQNGPSGNGVAKIRCRVDTNLANSNAGAVSSTLSTSTWYHLAGTWSAADPYVRLFVNGSPDGTLARSGATVYNDTTVVNIGQDGFGACHNGLIDEVRISSVQRSAEWIAFEYVSLAADVMTWGSDDTGATDYTRTIGDSVGVTDAASRIYAASRTQADAAGVTDLASRVYGANQSISNSVGLLDAVNRAHSANRSQADAVGLTDVAARVLSSNRALMDSVGMTDQIVDIVAYQRVVSDLVGIADQLALVAAYIRALDDTVGLTDAMYRTQAWYVDINDAVGLTDTTSRTWAAVKEIHDNLAVSDSVARVVYFLRTLQDTAGVQDAIDRITSYLRTVQDNVGLSDHAAAVLAAINRTAALFLRLKKKE